MKTKLLLILFISFSFKSYSQDDIVIDSKLQVKYADTLKSIGERLTGKWKYLGKKQNEILIDTIGASFTNGKRTTVFVKNGIVYKYNGVDNEKANYFLEITYDFSENKSFYARERKYFNKKIVSKTTSQPIPKIVYFKGKFGILFTAMSGQYFNDIKELTTKRLVIEEDKEYLRL